MSATIAHDAVVAGEGAVTNCVEYAEFVSQCPSLLLVEPHEGRVQAELLVHRKVKRHIKALDEAVATIGVAAEVGLPNTRNDIIDAVIAGIDGCNRDEEEVSAGYECCRVGVSILLLRFDVEFRVCQAASGTELADEADVHAFPRDTRLGTKLFCYLNLCDMPLPIAEAEGMYLVKMLECPVEAGCAVLPARKNNESFHVFIYNLQGFAQVQITIYVQLNYLTVYVDMEMVQ